MKKKSIRSSVRAIIIHNNKLLLCRYSDNKGDYYVCPGGGQEFGEDMPSALKRECIEEINCEVKVDDLVFVRDTMFKSNDTPVHYVAHFFKCQLVDKDLLRVGDKPDKGFLGIEWVELKKLFNLRLYPPAFKSCIHCDGTFDKKVYIE